MNILQLNPRILFPLFPGFVLILLATPREIPHKISTRLPIPEQKTAPIQDSTQWREITQMDSTIRLDIRYATANNFVGQQMYACGRCFLRPSVAKALILVHQELQKKGLGLKMYDCYRPLSVQWALWKKVPDARYVADPRKGSMHNRGSAVDLTIVNQEGEELDMGTPYDFFGPAAYIDYTKHPAEVLANRKTLQDLMIANGFRTTRTEWWHFSYTRASFSISDMTWTCP